MGFCDLKALNWFFRFSWKEKTCLLSAGNIEHKNFDKKIHVGWFIAFFKDFLTPLRISSKKCKKCQKSACTYKEEFFLRSFHTRCSPQIKDRLFLFTKIDKKWTYRIRQHTHPPPTIWGATVILLWKVFGSGAEPRKHFMTLHTIQ